MKKLLPLVLGIIGLIGGVVGGQMLKPAPEPVADGNCDTAVQECPKTDEEPIMALAVEHYDPDKVWDYVKLPKQFVIPIIKKERVSALVVLSISLEIEPGQSDAVLARAPKLKDGFLQVMFAHANSGGFDGAFTTGQSMKDLRGSLNNVARRYLGETVHDVLIEEIVKQET